MKQGKLNLIEGENGYTLFYCPGCKSPHAVRLREGPKQEGSWAWNGSYNAPTIEPSILVAADRPQERCHSFVTDGKIRFLDDCFHDMKGQTVEIPDWNEERFWED